MRKLLFIIAVLLTVIVLVACADELANYQTSASEPPPAIRVYNPSGEVGSADYADDFDGVRSHWKGLRMYVQADSVTPTGLRLSMINNSELNFGHGVMFRIEQYSGDRWEEVPIIDGAAWILPLLFVKPNTIVDEDISWEHMHGHLPPGQYRIVRNFIEEELFNPIPAWERDIPEADLYVVFTVEEDGWQVAHDRWQSEQDALAGIAFARFEGLDLEILEYSPRGLSFTLTNNNPNYSYIIVGVFVGWEDIFPNGGFAGSVEYFIYSQSFPTDSWSFGDDKRLEFGEYLFLEVDWYDEIGYLMPSMERDSSNPYMFELVIDVRLDVDEEYIDENFRHIMPRQLRLPSIGHRITAEFELLP